MKRRLLRRRVAPINDEPPPTVAFSDLCWLVAPEPSDEQVVLAEASIAAGRLALGGRPAMRWYPAAQDLRRLALIDVAASDVQLLFMADDKVLDITRLRFASETITHHFVTQLVAGYERSVGDAFPPTWLQRHPTGQIDES